MKIPIFTISRQFGSGGRTVGKRLAERLAIPCYDQELIEKIMEESGFTREFMERRADALQFVDCWCLVGSGYQWPFHPG